MGVKGLTSYVKQIRHAVSEEVTIPVKGADIAPSSSTTTPTGPFVIDGWAWIFRAYLDFFTESLRGGDYIGYTLHVRHFINALRQAGLESIFVFDGPYLPLKLPTVYAQMKESAGGNSAFMRSSSRSKPGFQVSMGVFPPLIYDCTLEALRQCKVQIVVEETEADSTVAELADSMGGWAVSNDSDFFILCARGTQCKGYVPIDTLEYLMKPPQKDSVGEADASAAAAIEDDGFAQVGKGGRAKGRKAGKHAEPAEVQLQVLDRPPQGSEEGSLNAIRFTSYSSAKVAAALGITTSMLPLLAALVGNDYTASIQKRILDPALPTGPQRIAFIANAIKTETLRMASPGNRASGLRSGTATPSASRNGLGRTSAGWGALAARSGAGSAMTSATATPIGDTMHPKLDEALAALALNDPVRFMVQSVVQRILAGVAQRTREAYVTSGEQEELVDAVIDSVATYSLLSDASAIHRSTPSAEFFADSKRSYRPAHRRDLWKYRDAYAKGHFDRVLVESLTMRICTNRMAPEDPDQKSIQSLHARDVRNWTFSTLFSTWGMGWARETLEEPLPEQEEEDDAEASHRSAIPILAGPGPNKVNWAEEGDPEELIPVQTPPSSFDSSMLDDEDEEEEEDDEVRSRPGSAVGLVDEVEDEGVKPAPVVEDYSRKGDRYAAEACPIWSFDTLVGKQREQLRIEPPAVLRKYLRT